MNIRRAIPADLDQLSVLLDQYRIFYKQTSDKGKAFSFLKERMDNNESVVFIAEENGTLTGFTQLYPLFSSVRMQRTWLLNDLYVDAAHRGKGIGPLLLDAAKEFGIAANVKCLFLQTGEDNITAQRVYEKHGWIKETDLSYRLDL